MHLDDGGLVTIGIGIRGRAAECLGPVSGESLDMLGVEAVAERMGDHVPLDCHLMIENADEFIPAFADAGANWVSVHYEACRHLHRSLELIAHHGMKPGVVLNPATRVDLIQDVLPMVHHVLIMSVDPGFGGQEFIEFSLGKIRRLVELRQESGLANYANV